MSNTAWAGGYSIDKLTLEAAEKLALKAIWSKQGHIRQSVDDDLMTDLLERLHLGTTAQYPMTRAEQLDESLNGRR